MSVRSSISSRSGGTAELLERLVAIPSVTGAEEDVVRFVEERLAASGWECLSIPVSSGRRDLLARRGAPAAVVLSTHADTVPPFLPPRIADGVLHGRGACDAKGSLAAMVVALESLARERPDLAGAGLLLVVGEERGSDGALAANASELAGDARYLVGGEPTGNRFVAGGKGCLRVTIETRGSAAHSSLAASRSAVDPLLDVLAEIRALRFPDAPVFGGTTANVGVIAAGTAPNVVAESGRAEVVFRTGGPVDGVLEAVRRAASKAGPAEVTVAYRSEPVAFRVPRAREDASEVVSFACDLPLLSRWGTPLLVGPGSISVAHAADEHVRLDEVETAAATYAETVLALMSEGEAWLA